MRRFLRIFPLYYGVVITAAVIGISGFRQPLVWHMAYCTNIYNSITGHWSGASAHLWSLSVEEQFYLCWPWIILLVPQRWLLSVVAIIGAVGPLFRLALLVCGYSNMPVYTLMPSSLDAFALGGLLAIGRVNWPVNPSSLRKLTRLALAIGAPGVLATLSSLALPGNHWWIFAVGANLTLALVFFWLIAGAAHGFGGWVGKLLNSSPLLYTGRHFSPHQHWLSYVPTARVGVELLRNGGSAPAEYHAFKG